MYRGGVLLLVADPEGLAMEHDDEFDDDIGYDPDLWRKQREECA